MSEQKKKPPLTCGKCMLYRPKEGCCGVTVMLGDGQQYEITVKPDDLCHWEAAGIEVQEIRAWSDGKDGHIEYTEGK